MTTKTFLILLVILLVDVLLSAKANTQIAKADQQKVLSRRKRFLIFPTGASFSVAVCMTIGVYGNPQFSMFSWALNYGFAYNLPSNSSYFLNPPESLLSYPFVDEDDEPPPTTTTTTTAAPETLPPEHYFEHDHDHEHDHIPTPEELQKAESTRRQYYVYYQPKYETKPMMQRRFRRDIYLNIEAVFDKMGYHGRECVLRALCESPQIFSMKQKTMIQELLRTVFSFPKSKVLPFEHSELLMYDEAHRKGRNKIICEEIYPKCGFSVIKMALGKYSRSPPVDFV